MKAWGSQRLGMLLFGGMLLCMGLFIGIETSLLGRSPSYAVVGPRVFPSVIAAGLVVIGLLELRAAFAGAAADEAAMPVDTRAVVLIAAAIALEILALPWLGWIPAAVLLFALVSRAFGERRWAWSLAIGISLAVLSFATFNVVLGLNLPVGRVIEAAAPHR